MAYSAHGKHRKHYVHLAVMTALMFAVMYALMYAMVDRFANVYSSLNQIYMAGLMTAPMVLIELAVMRSMYGDRRWNTIIFKRSARHRLLDRHSGASRHRQ